jgi:hypothetical protein
MIKTTQRVLSTIWWLGKGTATMVGVAIMLALTVGLASTALAAVPGDPFKLGRTNTIDHISTLVGSASGALLKVDNEGSGPALDLQVEPDEAPMKVDSGTKVADLNSDEVDGQSADDFVSEDKTYKVTELGDGPGGGLDETVRAECDSGDIVLGGGGSAPFAPDVLRISEPSAQGWRVTAQDNGNGSLVVANAICADFPPLR